MVKQIVDLSRALWCEWIVSSQFLTANLEQSPIPLHHNGYHPSAQSIPIYQRQL